MTAPLLRRVAPADVTRSIEGPVDRETLATTQGMLDDLRARGEPAVRELAEKFGDIEPGGGLVRTQADMQRALAELDPDLRGSLERAGDRIRAFAEAQRGAIGEVTVPVPGGEAGHTVEPVAAGGCYAPAGRYPLPSSVLMTALTARAAGVERVVVASPGAHPVNLAAAAIAGADEFLAIGGVQAVATLALGLGVLEPVDVVVGPGNRWVTAAKQLLSGVVGIDMLAGPSELLVLADETADPATVAADLLAQAEHDTDARAILVTTSESLAVRTDEQLRAQLDALPTREVASVAVANGFCCVCATLDEAIAVTDRVAPEHLEVMTSDAPGVARRVRNAGGVFVGAGSAEVLGDYGAGPNHTLPTGGTARSQAGLSVTHFLRLRTWLRVDDGDAASEMVADTGAIARAEGLIGHERSALKRSR